MLNRFWFEQVIKPSYSKGRLPFDEKNNKSPILNKIIDYFHSDVGKEWLEKLYKANNKQLSPKYKEDILRSLRSIHRNPKNSKVNHQMFSSPITVELYYSTGVNTERIIHKFEIKFGKLNIVELIEYIKIQLKKINKHFDELTIITPVCRTFNYNPDSSLDPEDNEFRKLMKIDWARQVSMNNQK